MNEEAIYKSYRVWLRSVPGMYAQYDGKVDVYARDAAEALEHAFTKLRRSSFPDRDRSMWRVEQVELLE